MFYARLIFFQAIRAKQQNKYLGRKTVIIPKFAVSFKRYENRVVSVNKIAKLTDRCRSYIYKALTACPTL